jgi:hypothetical protein
VSFTAHHTGSTVLTSVCTLQQLNNHESLNADSGLNSVLPEHEAGSGGTVLEFRPGRGSDRTQIAGAGLYLQHTRKRRDDSAVRRTSLGTPPYARHVPHGHALVREGQARRVPDAKLWGVGGTVQTVGRPPGGSIKGHIEWDLW